jgi:hypothetical protein
LETVRQKADWYSVQIERLEVFTSDVVQSINLVASEMECEGILLFECKKGGILLQLHEIKRLMEMPVRKLYVLRLPTHERVNSVQELRRRFSHWLNGRSKRQGEPTQENEYLGEEEELLVKA